MERDILKKSIAIFAGAGHEIPLHRRLPRRLPGSPPATYCSRSYGWLQRYPFKKTMLPL